MLSVYICGNNAISSLGFTTEEHIDKIKKDISGVSLVTDRNLYPENFYASLVDTGRLEREFSKLADNKAFTRFEKLMILSADKAIKGNPKIDVSSEKTIFIISSTKGNIDLLDSRNKDFFLQERNYLWKAAKIISSYFKNPNKPIIISNACISGVLAIINGANILSLGGYENAVIVGGDIVSEFVVSGFLSFKSLAFGICKPFDANRNGLNLGEGAGTLILTNKKENISADTIIEVSGGASNNDANHISGPSRTGEGLYLAISRAMKQAGVDAGKIDFVSAHGTATPFNDEMESKAFAWVGLSDVPLNSLKAFFGHTLGAAGIIESVISLYGMQENKIYKTLGYEEYGVPERITIAGQLLEKEQYCILKTASGFGGCNAAVVFEKE
ncbi:MAG: beta-ketoacyl synthase N-terminal-like domain-containing protein [Bacteroidales bacterium]|jgi:3-oxoacyl-[acyl-carrier-protein] synthase-1|nr:hypothetical protein [Bacteroidales bacterium]MDD4213689.1 beta-ketoacyl synthase N-terminal-like domain-containing protein [Bacteroidales bacterium]